MRFYLKYIQPNKGKIESGYFVNRSLSHFPGWDSIMGLQFENLVLNNRTAIWKKLHIQPQDIISDNPFFQRKTVRMAGCQFDYLIHVRHNIIFCCEIKFSHEPIKNNVIIEMKKKIEKLSLPKGFSCKPVLIYVNGVETSVINADYFAHHIDFGELLNRSET